MSKKFKIAAVIDIGSSAIRMLIAERHVNAWRRLDSLEKKTELGYDTFSDGDISREGMLECLKILDQFIEVLRSWEVPLEDVTVIGTTALRQAQNRDVFVDRVFLRTGLRVRVIEGVEANQLTYTAVLEAMRESWPKFNQANSVVIEVSGGSTEVMILHRGSMVASHTFQTGTIKIQQQLKHISGSMGMMSGIIQDNMSHTLDIFEHDYPLKKIRHFVALGSELRHLAASIGVRNNKLWEIEVSKFEELMRRLSVMSNDQIAHKYNIPLNDAISLLPLCTVYQSLLERTAAKVILVPDVSIRDGVLISMVQKGKESKRKFKSQVIASAKSLGKKFLYDETHANFVTKNAKILFDALKKDHVLTDRHRLLLEVASILHDIGSFINQSAHHKHGYYIIRNSEIFGLNNEDINIISHVVRYHRKALPVSYHTEFIGLERDVRVIIMKLAAILRVADSLDSGHSQRVSVLKVDYDEENFKIFAEGIGEKSLEVMSLNNKADLFEEVYGLKVIVSGRSSLF